MRKTHNQQPTTNNESFACSRQSSVVSFRTGFSLVELLIVMAIISILGVGSILNFSGRRNKNNLDLTANEIVGSLRSAQNGSITQEDGYRWGVYFSNSASSTNDSYQIFKGSSYSTSGVVKQINLKSGITFTNPVDGATKSIIFYPLTGKSASSTITINAANIGSYDILVDQNGVISATYH